MRSFIFAVVMLVATGMLQAVDAQRFGRGRGAGFPGYEDFERFNVPYDGSFIFVRLRFTPLTGFRRSLMWDHDYPYAERHLATILEEFTTIVPMREHSNILALDDPELFKYPIAYMSEPGFWTLTESEAMGLRAYLLKGGFVIFDDFSRGDWYNFAEQLRRVLPDHRLVRLDPSHPIFHVFYDIDSFEGFVHPNEGIQSEFWGVFEDNDPDRRLLLIANYNNDIGDAWEWSDTGYIPFDLTNQAYKLGINYLIYAMTH